MKDIETRNDLEILLQQFYNSLLTDNSINYIFTEIAKTDLGHHLPLVTDFWEQSLFHTGSYRTNVMKIHLEINQSIRLEERHFETWLSHFDATVDAWYSGENAEKIKTRALSIATVMKIKIASIKP